jgi:hypothetical protein
MEFLTRLFDNLTSGIIRLGVAVGILAAISFFILKPVLHSTDDAVDKADSSFERSFRGSTLDRQAIEAKVEKTIQDVNKQVQAEVERSFHASRVRGSPEKILHCLRRADGNVRRIERCARRY